MLGERAGGWSESTNPPTVLVGGFAMRCRRRPTLPRSRERSTIGAVGLNDRVRNGNECGPYALVASEFGVSEVVLRYGFTRKDFTGMSAMMTSEFVVDRNFR